VRVEDPGRVYNILYVDDEEINLDLFKWSFKKTFNVYVARSAKEALDILNGKKIPVVLTDYRMPGMNGILFINEIKKINPKPICLIVTAHLDTIEDVKEEDIYRVIYKPWKKEDMYDAIRSAIEYYEQNLN